MTRRPTVGLLGISGLAHDPELGRHHEGFLAQVGRRLTTRVDVVSGVPADSAEALAELEAALEQAPEEEQLECARGLLDVSPGFAAAPGPLTTAAFARPDGDELRLVVGSGELLAGAPQPVPRQPRPLFAPDVGLEAFMDAWLELGAAAEFLIVGGDRHARWRRLADMLEIEYEEI